MKKLTFFLLLALSCIVNAQAQDADWTIVEYNVRVVCFDLGISERADLFRNTINGRYFIAIRDEANRPVTYEFKNQVYHSDDPSYTFMFYYSGGNRYFTPQAAIRLPNEDNWEYVHLVRAYSRGRAKYVRLYKREYSDDISINECGYYDTMIYESDDPSFTYYYSDGHDNWYFNP